MAIAMSSFSKMFHLFLFLYLSLPLFIKFRKQQVPFRQVLMLDTALKFTELLDRYKINYVLLTGSLLGVVRQKAFAGRPRDFDIAIKKEDRVKLLQQIGQFKIDGFFMYECKGRRDKANGFIVAFPNMLRRQDKWGQIDVHTYTKSGEFWRWDRWDHDIPKITFGIEFPILGSEVYGELFGFKFKIPPNYEEYLVALYGSDWRVPNSKQYAWRS